jgi:hypothetical protein
MLLLGFYSELFPRRLDITQGSIRDAISPRPFDHELEIISYLGNGIPLVDIMEATIDVVAGNEYIAGGSSIVTDGVWIWRLDLPYYVGRYHLKLSDEFMSHANQMEFNVPSFDIEYIIDMAQSVTVDILNMRTAKAPRRGC